MAMLEMVLLSAALTVTSYRSIPSQTDNSPFHTSIGERTHPGGCAVSRDLLNKEAPYGTYLYIDGIGLCRVNDTMNERHRRAVDLWVATYEQEKQIGVRRLAVYKVQLPKKALKEALWTASLQSTLIESF